MVTRITKIEYAFFILVVVLFLVSGGKFYYTEIERIEAFAGSVVSNFDHIGEDCGPLKKELIGGGGYVCVEDNDESIHTEIYMNYPRSNGGKENLYTFLDKGSVDVADQYVENYIVVPRFEPVLLEDITWTEDPYYERYWRFLHYSLRETRHLLFAWKETGDDVYVEKLTSHVTSFLEDGVDQKWAWDDRHGVAFRAMVLTNIWWELREDNRLDQKTSGLLLASIEEHADFLMLENNYEGEHNHAVAQASALFLLGVNFPDLEGANEWQELGRERLKDSIVGIIDEDGILVENSPYYHFYVLEKYWELYQYSKEHNTPLGREFTKRLESMIAYGSYILQPDGSVPLLGASVEREVNPYGYYRNIIETNNEFEYVLSEGESGNKPKQNIYYPVAGRTILRSGWGESRAFEDETQVVFDVGPFRTSHSDYDALTFLLFSNGVDFIVDPGLFTYEDGLEKEYYKSTRAHNTVSVNGESQLPSTPAAGELIESYGNISHQTAVHTLFRDVTHYRTIALLDHDLVLVIDHLQAEEKNEYTQTFRLHPDAEIATSSGNVDVIMGEGDKRMRIHQLGTNDTSLEITKGQLEPFEGWCSLSYEIEEECYSLQYKTSGATSTYITLFEIGDQTKSLHIIWEDENDIEAILYGKKTYTIDFDIPDEQFVVKEQVREEIEQSTIYLEFNRTWEVFTKNGDKLRDYKVYNDEGLITIDIPRDTEVTLDAGKLGLYRSRGENLYTNIPFSIHEQAHVFNVQEDFIPIFGYHDVLTDDKTITRDTLQIHESNFDAHMDFATNELHCSWITFKELMEDYVLVEKKPPTNSCLINFDDSNASDYDLAFPILEKYGVKATFFVIPGRHDTTKVYMKWDEVDELFKAGHEIANHTYNSGSLTEAGYSKEQIAFQLSEAKLALEDRGYDEVTTFAYPLGDWNKEIIEVLQETGHIAARDTSVDNGWRDRRTVTTSFDPEFIWHMHYHKPEKNTVEDLRDKLGYTSWWQFEEGYRTSGDWNRNITDRSKVSPTDTSFASVLLPDWGDQIENKFIIPHDDTFTIELFVSIPNTNVLPTVTVNEKSVQMNLTDASDCVVHEGIRFCAISGEVELEQGTHVLSVLAKQRMFVDKFRVLYSVEPMQRIGATLQVQGKPYIVEIIQNTPRSMLEELKQKRRFILF